MTEPNIPPERPVGDKRDALLAAAIRLIARNGLHNTPTAAVAREAGVATGTLYLYFPSKETLLNALYLELLGEQRRASAADARSDDEAAADPRELLWHSWHGLARWHLDHPEATRVLQQLRGSGILTAETRAAEERARAEGLAHFHQSIARGVLRDLPLRAFWALYAGPTLAVVEAANGGTVRGGEVAAEVIRATFDGVCRSVLPAPEAAGGRRRGTRPRRAALE
jgi:TetR/AcrR family transcriptional regulator, repressor of fatR-cypB operon